MKQRNNLILLTIVMTLVVGLVFSQSYPLPTHMSPYDIANWVIRSGHIASGTATPPTSSVQPGCLYVDESIATQPQLWRYSGSNWYLISGGTRKHSELQELDYASSGHTGFAASSQIPTNASFTLSGLGEKNYSSLTGKPTNASYTLAGLSEKNFASLAAKPTTLLGYGITDGVTQASFVIDVGNLSTHIADAFDPHGATMTISDSLYIGSGPYTVSTYSDDDGVYVISASETKLLGVARATSYAQLVSVSAAPTSALASDVITFWGDSASDTLMIHNGNSWQNLGGSYAELHAHDNSTGQSIATGTTYAKITALIGAGPYNDAAISTSTQEITINRAGTYRVALNVSFYSDTNNVIAYFAAFKGTSELDNIHFERKIGTGADVGSSAASGYVTCAAGDIITLRARHDYTAAVTLTVTYANLNVERIGN